MKEVVPRTCLAEGASRSCVQTLLLSCDDSKAKILYGNPCQVPKGSATAANKKIKHKNLSRETNRNQRNGLDIGPYQVQTCGQLRRESVAKLIPKGVSGASGQVATASLFVFPIRVVGISSPLPQSRCGSSTSGRRQRCGTGTVGTVTF
jgi:hypothetical protein